jgi:hypothetical protein
LRWRGLFRLRATHCSRITRFTWSRAFVHIHMTPRAQQQSLVSSAAPPSHIRSCLPCRTLPTMPHTTDHINGLQPHLGWEHSEKTVIAILFGCSQPQHQCSADPMKCSPEVHSTSDYGQFSLQEGAKNC